MCVCACVRTSECACVRACELNACVRVIVVSVIAMGIWVLCKSGLLLLLVVVVLVVLVVLPCNVTS